MDYSAFDSDATISEFLDEARTNMTTVNRRLLEAERSPLLSEAVNELFRGAHSLKGLAGMFNLTPICQTTHALETVFDRIRKATLTFTPEVIAASFEAVDLIGALLDDLAEKSASEREISTTVQRLQAIVPAKPEPHQADQPAWSGLPEMMLPVFEGVDLADLAMESAGKTVWLLRLPVQELLARQRDLVQTWLELERVLTIVAVRPISSGDPSPWVPLDRFDWQLGLVVLTTGNLQDSLAPLLLPRHDGWSLDLARRTGERRIFLPAPSTIQAGGSLTVKEGMAQHLPIWLAETQEELEGLDEALLALERTPDDTEPVQAAFRMAHRIKGSAGAMGLDVLARIAHNLEWALDLLRTKRLSAGGPTVEALLAVKDWIAQAVQAVKQHDQTVPNVEPVEAALASLGEQAAPAPQTGRATRGWHPDPEALVSAQTLAAKGMAWLATIELRHDCHLPDLRCQLILSHLQRVATIVSSRPHADELAAGTMTGHAFHIFFVSEADEPTLRDCLQVDEVLRCDLRRHEAPAGALPMTSASNPATAIERKQAVEPARPASVPPQVQPVFVAPAAAIDELVPAKAADHLARTTVAATVRVEAHRLDQLMNIAGEMVVAKARIAGLTEQLARHLNSPLIADLRALLTAVGERAEAGQALPGFGPERLARIRSWSGGFATVQATAGELSESVVGLHRSTAALQANAMQMRMVPVAPLFQRFHRVVRDLCRELGKQARLEMHGEATELDKKLIDELVDPLTHLVRNALDHGLEPVASRIAAGKSEAGTVTLSAFQEGGQICIRITDDGRGIDPARIRAKAVEKGIITQLQADTLDDAGARALVFLPGFSTAVTVSNVSGRGVGMDIVRSKISELKGTVDIDSAVGKGTSFTIRLPLTLAMIQALLVEIGGERHALPLDAVREIVEIDAARIHRVDGGGAFIPLRDGIVALADLPRTIGLKPHVSCQGTVRAVITKGGREPLAIPVDRVLREEEIVVKALPEEFARVRGLAGASILGDGGIALILDIPIIIERSRATAGSGHA